MNYNRKYRNIFCISLICVILLIGCNQSSSNEASTSAFTESTIETATADESATSESASVTTKTITISVVNLSKIDAGMFSVIDPATGEQLNTDGLASGETISLDCNWPLDVTQFQWALYNLDGELCIEATTDISEANDKVSLVLVGTDTIENVEVLFE